jgi:hypothetical protein
MSDLRRVDQMVQIECIRELERVIVAMPSDMFAAAENGGGEGELGSCSGRTVREGGGST